LSIAGLSPDKTAKSVKDALIDTPTTMVADVKMLSYGHGKAFALHESIAKTLESIGDFAHPYRSWTRGLNERMNGLIRQYAPKGSCFDHLTEEDAKRIMNKLNNRPRKCLCFRTPNEIVFVIKSPIALAS
jgi:IS30 family transposase